MRTSTAPESSAKAGLTTKNRRVLHSTFSVDSRALAIVRIMLAALILAHSLAPGVAFGSEVDGFYGFLTENAHIAVIPFAVMLLVGYRTRLAVVVCWFLYSLPIRADLMADLQLPMAYVILNLGLFWCMFLPLDRHLSIRSSKEKTAPVRLLSVASAAILLQIFVIYFSAGLYKDMGEWLLDATAMQSLLANPRFMTPLGTALLDYPTVLAVMSIATVVVEVVGAVLLIYPGKSLERRRLVVVPVFIGFHLGIAIFMGLYFFAFVMIALLLLFLPSGLWDRVWSRLGLGNAPAEPATDSNRWRNGVVGVAAAIAVTSNVITWTAYPHFREVEGILGAFQEFALFLLLYQQWLMFNVPSLIPT